MSEKPRFRIYYADGTTYDGDPELAPSTGVIVVAIPDEDANGRLLLHRQPYYCWHVEWQQWTSHDEVGFWMCMAKTGWKRVIFGETVSNERYHAIYRKAYEDPVFPIGNTSPRQTRAPDPR